MPEERPAKVDGIIGVSDESVIAETVLDTKLFVSMIWGRARSKVVANPISPTHSKRQNMTAPTAHFAPKQMCQISLDCHGHASRQMFNILLPFGRALFAAPLMIA